MKKGENICGQYFLLFPQRFLLMQRQIPSFDPYQIGDFHITLSLSKCQIFTLFQAEEFPDNSFLFDENGSKFSKRLENTVGKGEIARFEQFLLFPQ